MRGGVRGRRRRRDHAEGPTVVISLWGVASASEIGSDGAIATASSSSSAACGSASTLA
eukprot:CAMPEP_0174855256 /NCGR_PEP_ID=MMETSP1114-20130205/32850_1 /TAXON_ID=312471 /ORGANISM="Neobodo designis, Strain CCAP 1951/1" /LENGTH=57 /DNA_ID=CAMNT_0016089991 /DNA_START=209 /DNA_END=378 /DNA_ORIENTATION=+